MNPVRGTAMKTVGEVCQAANVTRKTLYYYDRIGLLKPTERSGGQNYKLYDDDAVDKLKRIREMRRAGLKIAEIKTVLNDPGSLPDVVSDAISRLTQEKTAVEQQISCAEKLLSDHFE